MPGTDDGVGKTHEEGREDHECGELDALGYRTGDDGRGSRGEHGLEDEVSVTGHGESKTAVTPPVAAFGIEVADRSPDRDPSVEIAGVVSVEADEGVGHDTDRDDETVLKENVDRVLRLRETHFERGKAEVHDEDHGSSHDGPQHRDGEEVKSRGKLGPGRLHQFEVVINRPGLGLSLRSCGSGCRGRFLGGQVSERKRHRHKGSQQQGFQVECISHISFG